MSKNTPGGRGGSTPQIRVGYVTIFPCSSNQIKKESVTLERYSHLVLLIKNTRDVFNCLWLFFDKLGYYAYYALLLIKRLFTLFRFVLFRIIACSTRASRITKPKPSPPSAQSFCQQDSFSCRVLLILFDSIIIFHLSQSSLSIFWACPLDDKKNILCENALNVTFNKYVYMCVSISSFCID